MTQGKVLVADVDNLHILRLEGDVRMNLCCAFSEHIKDTLKRTEQFNILIDMSKTEGIDSTMLGQLAKLSIKTRQQFNHTPTICSPKSSIRKTLDCMGFDKVFYIIQDNDIKAGTYSECSNKYVDEECVRSQVISAHKALMSLNQKNEQTFVELVNCLEMDNRH